GGARRRRARLRAPVPGRHGGGGDPPRAARRGASARGDARRRRGRRTRQRGGRDRLLTSAEPAYGVPALAKVVSAAHDPPAQNSACSTLAETCDALVHFLPSWCTSRVAIATRGCEAGGTPMNHS